mmetsp:Transcript_19172/g.49515  ORF Transcript_19172/g.49515 Transcript_19172/m.49515 type:complete len:295 (-) Transcript_19172:201-1085(-)
MPPADVQSRNALWAWLREQGVHAPKAVACGVHADAVAAVNDIVRELGGPPCVIRCHETDHLEDDDGVALLVASRSDLERATAHVRAVQAAVRPSGTVVLRDDRANGRIGLLLHRPKPIIVMVEAGCDFATALSAHLILSSRPSAHECGIDDVAVSCAGNADRQVRRTRSLFELNWQLNKIYKSIEAGPAGRFADDPESWAKVRWAAQDAERILQRAELTAWIVRNRRKVPCPTDATSSQYAVHLEFHFVSGPQGLPGQPLSSSDLDELIVVDVRPVGSETAIRSLLPISHTCDC